MLVTSGMQLVEISERSGISGCYAWFIAHGRTKRIHRGIAERILRVDAKTMTPQSRVDGRPIWALIQRLLHIGFRPEALAALVNLPVSAFQRRQVRMRLERAHAIMQLYTDLRQRVPGLRELEEQQAA